MASQAALQPASSDTRLLDVELRLEPGRELVRTGSPGYLETSRCVGRINSPGSLMPTSIIRQKLGGSSWPW